MSKKRIKNKELKKHLFTKNRLLILNEDSFEEIFSLRLTLMNVLVVLGFGAIAIITATIFLIAFTPLKGFIPGFSSSQLKKDATELALKSDSLTIAIQKNEAYLGAIKKVLNGELEYQKVNKDSILAAPEQVPDVDLKASDAELELRQEVAEEDKKDNPVISKKKKSRK
jgi:hypothetical protein